LDFHPLGCIIPSWLAPGRFVCRAFSLQRLSGAAPAVNIQPLTFLITAFTTSGFKQSYSFPYSEFVILPWLLSAQPHGIPNRSRDVWLPFFFPSRYSKLSAGDQYHPLLLLLRNFWLLQALTVKLLLFKNRGCIFYPLICARLKAFGSLHNYLAILVTARAGSVRPDSGNYFLEPAHSLN